MMLPKKLIYWDYHSFLILLIGVLSSLLLFFSFVAKAEVPPLTSEEIINYADHIFTGQVLSIAHHDIEDYQEGEYVNRHWRLVVRVNTVYQTMKSRFQGHPNDPDETLTDNEVIHVMMWKAHKRPPYTVGPQGVHGWPKVGQNYSFFSLFLHRDEMRRSMYHRSFPHEEGGTEEEITFENFFWINDGDDSRNAAAKQRDVDLGKRPQQQKEEGKNTNEEEEEEAEEGKTTSSKKKVFIVSKAYNLLNPNGLQEEEAAAKVIEETSPKPVGPEDL